MKLLPRTYPRLNRTRAGLLALCLAILAGCQAGPPPATGPILSDAQVLEALAARAQSIDRLSSRAVVRLRSSQDDSIQLDAVIIAAPPDRLRIAASKFNRTVFDLTAREGQAYLRIGSDVDEDARASLQALSGDLAGALLDVVTLRLFARSDLRVTRRSERDVDLTAAMTPDVRVTATVQRQGARVQAYRFTSASGAWLATVTLSSDKRDAIIADHLAIRSDQGEIEIWLDDIEINPELPAGAFTPPRQAVLLKPRR